MVKIYTYKVDGANAIISVVFFYLLYLMPLVYPPAVMD